MEIILGTFDRLGSLDSTVLCFVLTKSQTILEIFGLKVNTRLLGLFTFTIPMNCEVVVLFKSTIYASIICQNNIPFRMAK